MNCGQGLTYIEGQHKPNWSAYGETWRVRGNIGFDSAFNPEISVGDFQTRRYTTVAGGPRVLMGGGSPTCNPQYDSGTQKTYFPDSGEYFDGDVRYWCSDTRAITAVGISSDGRYLYFGISKSGNTVTQLAQWLKSKGAHEVLRFDSGSSTGMYHNGQFIGGTGSKPIASALAVIVLPGSSPDTTPPSGDYTSPANGATVGRTVRLAAWASDSGSGVREVHFTAKWSGQWHLVYNDTSAPYEYDWDLCASGVPDGDIELGLDIWDNAGNVFHLHTVHPNPHITKSYNCSAPSSTWSVDYWNNKYLAGYPNWHNNEAGTYIFRDWGDNGPGGGIQVNEWSARFVRTVYFPGGNYRFHCQHDDGCRIFVDGQNCIDAWWDSSFDGHDCARDISAGNHEVKVEFYDNQGGARLEAWWQGPGFLPRDQTCDPNQWCAEYWGNRNLSGTPAIRRNEGETLWHDWGSGGPDPTFPADNFSSRFVRNATFTCGTYRFRIFADDGVRFWVDNVLRLNQWRDQVANYDVDISLSSGTHALKVEHYENGGGAGIHLTWERLSECPPNVTVEYASTHYARPGAAIDPTVRVRVTAGYLQGSRGDNLTLVGGSALGAATSQPVYGTVNEGSTYTFDVVNSSSFRMTAPSAEGTYDSRWRVKAAGNLIGPEATVRVVVDGTPPTIGIQSPVQGAFINTNNVTVQATPQDANGIDQVQFFVGYDNGSGWAWYNLGWDLDGSDGWSRTWDAAGVPDQRGVAFYAYAWDRAGNGAGTAVWDVTLDRTPPTTSIRPLAATQDSTAFIVWWDASDNAAGIDHLDLQVRQDGGAWQDWHLGVGGQYVGAWFVGEMGHRYGFRMRGVDRAGNAEAYPGSAEAETTINFCSGDAYEADNGPGQARAIAPGQSQNHNFCGMNDEDWVKFQARAGQRYVLETGNLGFASDTVLTLYDADGTTVLAENDDIAYPDNLASRVAWVARRDGWLYARVRHWDGRVAGNAVTYTLRLEEGYRLYLPLVLRNR
ncbi:MAG: phosphodiester glycosidase family protein [Thermoflexales bacterium]|nr:phosphodiester glycosidase family protein [Thermoflexales bacterium]